MTGVKTSMGEGIMDYRWEIQQIDRVRQELASFYSDSKPLMDGDQAKKLWDAYMVLGRLREEAERRNVVGWAAS